MATRLDTCEACGGIPYDLDGAECTACAAAGVVPVPCGICLILLQETDTGELCAWCTDEEAREHGATVRAAS